MRTFFDSATGLLVKPISGHTLQRNLRRYPATLRALLAYDLHHSSAALTDLTPRQAAMVTATRMVDVRTVAHAAPLELEALKRGRLTIERLHQQQLLNRRPSDADIDRFIADVGASRVFDALDRATRPNKALVTNGHAAAANDNNDNGCVTTPVQLSL